MARKLIALVFCCVFFLGGCASRRPPASDQEPAAADLPSADLQPAASATPTPDPNEKIKETKSLKGVFRGFESGDYRKASIELSGEDYGGEEDYALNNDPALLYFLAANLNKTLEFTYNVLERTGAQRGTGTGEIERLIAAKDEKGLTHEAWWQQQKAATPDEAALRAKLDPLVTQATRKEDEEEK